MTSNQTDNVATDILNFFRPAILQEATPATPVKTRGDGNCLCVCRAVSKAITGDETSHVLLRFTTFLELVNNHAFYYCNHRKHMDSTCDNRFMCGSFEPILNDAVTINTFSGMSHIYALSAALRKGVRGQPVRAQLHAEFVSEP